MTAPFRAALGAAFEDLPPVVRAFHGGTAQRRFVGQAEVVRGRGALAALACSAGGFPPASPDAAFEVTVCPVAGGEVWMRRFKTSVTRSHVTCGSKDGRLRERFGLVTCTLEVQVQDGILTMDVAQARLARVLPLPRWLTPSSKVRVWQDTQARYRFDIAVQIAGRDIVSYRGWVVQEGRDGAAAGRGAIGG